MSEADRQTGRCFTTGLKPGALHRVSVATGWPDAAGFPRSGLRTVPMNPA